MIHRDQITGIVLAGGLGRRMKQAGQTTNKALRLFQNRPLVEHVIERLKPQVGQLKLNVNQQLVAFERYSLSIVPDDVGGFAGPLAGLHAGLCASTTDWVITSPCDTPFLPTDLVEKLADAADRDGCDLAVAHTGAQAHPVFALVNSGLRDNLGVFLAAGGRKIDAWYDPLNVTRVNFDDEQAFRNINTPDDLSRYESDS